MSPPAIAIAGLRRRFNGVEALRGVDLQIQGPGVYGFLGVNGAGKTTTLRVLAGLIRADAGELRLLGRTLDDPALRRELGYLAQEPRYYPWMTGTELLVYAAELYGIDRATARRRAGELCERLDLAEASRRRIAGYSGGMLQRLGIAQALISEPALLLLDEPVSALDPLGRAAMLQLLRELGAERTVFFSTHILADVERICDEVAILHRGEVLVHEPTAALRQRFWLPQFELLVGGAAGALVDALAAEPWLEGLEHSAADNGDTLVVLRASDSALAQHRLPGLVAAHDLALRRFARREPSLEQVFVELVSARSAEQPS